MKVAFCNRPTWDNPLGGDGVQMLKTKEALERLYNMEIMIITNPKEITNEYDLVHIFNFVTYKITKSFFERAIELRIPIASSSIFWDYTYASNRFMNFFIGDYFSVVRSNIYRVIAHSMAFCLNYPQYLTKRFRKEYKYFCNMSSVILPNSIEEGELLQTYINSPTITDKIHVVYNGVCNSSKVDYLQSDAFFSKYQIPTNYILQVARIEPVKNQINLLYSLKDNKEIPIVFVGKVVCKEYYAKLRKKADKRGNVYFINAVPHEEIDNFYRYASLHVLLSLRESPGLVSLEALANNCPIVVANSKYAPVSTYFSSQPYIVNPFNIKEIKKVILNAYKVQMVVKDDMKNFSWDMAAKQTYEAYQRIGILN